MEEDKVISLASYYEVAGPPTALLSEKASALGQAAIEAECAGLPGRLEQTRYLQGVKATVRTGH
jgi:hypothetical protein